MTGYMFRLFFICCLPVFSSCSLWNKSASSESSFVRALQKLGQLENRRILIPASAQLPNDNFHIDENVKGRELRPFLESYLEMNKLQLIERSDQLVVGNLADFEGIWEHDAARAEELSKAQGKPILVKLTADWCGACRIQTKIFYKEDKLFSELQNFILLKIESDDVRKELPNPNKTNQAFLEKYKIPLDHAPIVAAISGEKVKILNTDTMARIEDWTFYWGELLTFRKSLASN